VEEVTRVKMANSDTILHSLKRKIMKKFIFIIDFLVIVVRLMKGESIEGRLFYDKENKRITFQPWYRKSPKNKKQHKLCDLDGGWLGESDLHIVRHEKFPKSLGLKKIIDLFRRDEEQTREALENKDVIDHV